MKNEIFLLVFLSYWFHFNILLSCERIGKMEFSSCHLSNELNCCCCCCIVRLCFPCLVRRVEKLLARRFRPVCRCICGWIHYIALTLSLSLSHPKWIACIVTHFPFHPNANDMVRWVQPVYSQMNSIHRVQCCTHDRRNSIMVEWKTENKLMATTNEKR